VELDSKNLGRIRRVANPRDVWTSESADFTPWLADNIDVLADELGMTLTVTGTEVLVGEFRLDIRAEDQDGHVVIIENQMERTDHSHLGQCLVYASGLSARTVVWVAPTFRDDFRRAFDWLNEMTGPDLNFFGVEVGVVQIGDGPRAPVFEVVARPNDWQKLIKTGGGTVSGATAASPRNAQRQDFFAEILREVIVQIPAIRMPSRSSDNWLSFASGPFGYWALSAAANGRLRVEAYLDSGDRTVNERLYNEFHADAAAIEAAVGFTLEWEELPGKRACRIARYLPFDIEDEASRPAAKAWAVASLTAMYGTLNERLRARARTIRDEVRKHNELRDVLAHDAGADTPPHDGIEFKREAL